MTQSFAQFRSSALVPGVELWPSEWSALNRALLAIPREVPLLRHLRMRHLEPRHREGLHLLHTRLFPIRYDARFYNAACRVSETVAESHHPAWSQEDLIGVGMFLPRSVLTDHSDCSALICCETPPSSARSDSPSSSSRRCSSLSSVSTNSDGPNFDQDVNDSSGDPAYASDLLPPAAEPRAPAGAPVDCILNDATYDKEKDEFLVGFVTIWINRHEFSHIVADSDYYSLESFYQDMIFPFLQTAGGHVEGLPTHPNFALMPPDFYRFLFTNLYCNSPLLDYLAALNLGDCKTVYLLSAGVTMGLRSRLLGTHLILFAQCMVYFSAYNVFLYNGSMFHGRDELFHSALRRLHLHLAADSGGSLDLDDLTEAEVGPYRLSASSVLDYYRKCEELPLTMYLHVIEYNKRACQMYRRANFICVTRIEGFYSINGSQYTANMFAYYMCPPCEL